MKIEVCARFTQLAEIAISYRRLFLKRVSSTRQLTIQSNDHVYARVRYVQLVLVPEFIIRWAMNKLSLPYRLADYFLVGNIESDLL